MKNKDEKLVIDKSLKLKIAPEAPAPGMPLTPGGALPQGAPVPQGAPAPDVVNPSGTYTGASLQNNRSIEQMAPGQPGLGIVTIY